MTGTVAASLPSRSAILAIVAHARAVPSARREAFAEVIEAIPEGAGHIVVHTCHRVELYLAPDAFPDLLPAAPAGAERLDNAAAALHLIAVACGLDSAVFGEGQILHQLRETIAERHGGRALHPLLDRLFQAALHAGRTAHGWQSGAPRSLADVALDRIASLLPDELPDAPPDLAGRRILVVGAGRMGRLAAFAANRRGAHVLVANRTAERATALAREVSGEPVAFELNDSLPPLDGAVVAVGGRWPLREAPIRALADLRLPVVDMSSPPAVPRELQHALRDRFVSVDDLAEPATGPTARLRRRLEKLVSETGRDYCQWIRAREAVPAIQAVVASAEEHRQAELDWLVRRLPGMAPDELAAVEQMSHRLVAALLHAPLAALNTDGSGDLERAARELFGV